MDSPQKVEFYYANIKIYWLLRIFGMALLGVIFVGLLGRLPTNVPFSIVLRLTLDAIAFIATVAVPFVLAAKITHRKATAYFYEDRLELHLSFSKVVLLYSDISQISWYYVLYGSARNRRRSPANYRLKIWHTGNPITIAASYIETNQAAKQTDFRPSLSLSLSAVCEKLSANTGLSPKDYGHRQTTR